MNTLSSDAYPAVERFHIELICKIPLPRRLQRVPSLIKTTRQLFTIPLKQGLEWVIFFIKIQAGLCLKLHTELAGKMI
jgi:hypothetical protein